MRDWKDIAVAVDNESEEVQIKHVRVTSCDALRSDHVMRLRDRFICTAFTGEAHGCSGKTDPPDILHFTKQIFIVKIKGTYYYLRSTTLPRAQTIFSEKLRCSVREC